MKRLAVLPLLCIASLGFAQRSPNLPEDTPSKPALIRVDPVPVIPMMDGNVLRLGLMKACTAVLETQAFNNKSYVRGKEIVPDEAALYRQQVEDYIGFACPCTVNVLDKDVGLTSATPEKLAEIRSKFGPTMQQICSRDAYITQLKK